MPFYPTAPRREGTGRKYAEGFDYIVYNDGVQAFQCGEWNVCRVVPSSVFSLGYIPPERRKWNLVSWREADENSAFPPVLYGPFESLELALTAVRLLQ